MPAKAVTKSPANIVDTYVEMPEGSNPSKIHLLLNRKVVKFADQYKNALFSARGIPHNMATIAISDRLSVLFVQYGYTANAAIQEAIATYQRWANDADQEFLDIGADLRQQVRW